MRPIEEIVQDLAAAEDAPPELFNELFWSAMARGLATGTGAWGRLFADVRGWTKSGGDNAETNETRMSAAEASELVRKVLGTDPGQGDPDDY